ncbi:hypothetical protein F4859DRAFT_512890 [Xylaria cf. heliscus]|nr:hypothetical protein F4859DRAFT_512890 [Xylaria cf. heliscus]
MPSSSLRQTIEITTRDFLKSAELAGAIRDPGVVTRSLGLECRRQIVPRSFMEGMRASPPDRLFSNAEAKSAATENLQVSSVVKTEILNLTIDEEARMSAARTVSVMKFRDGEEMTLENSWFFELVEDGSKIIKIVEFCGELLARKRVEKTVELLMKKTAMGGCDTLGRLVATGEAKMSGTIYDGRLYPSMM